MAARSMDNRATKHDGTCVYPHPDRDFKCGIYPRSLSPFLHGRTLLQGTSETLLPSEVGYPRRMPDALGDHVAFAALEHAMTRVGLLDWRPDGVVNSKLQNGPDEVVGTVQSTPGTQAILMVPFLNCVRVCVLSQANAEYDAKDGQLFNIHVQGPAIVSNWCGTEHSRSLVAGDKLFVAIVADCWVGCGDKHNRASFAALGTATTTYNKYKHLPAEMQSVYNTQTSVVGGDLLDKAAQKREEILRSFHEPTRIKAALKSKLDENGQKGPRALELVYSKMLGLEEMRVGRTTESNKDDGPGVSAHALGDYHSNETIHPHLLCNFRLKYVTSSQMVETSKLALDEDGGVAMGPN
eukprot:154512-Prymnesium_polylepis.1